MNGNDSTIGLLAATTTLSEMRWRDLHELMSLHRPPPALSLLAEAVCLMFGLKSEGEKGYWMPFLRLRPALGSLSLGHWHSVPVSQ
jgi:hypothetical protein